ncbi:MAG: O-antigen ligase family protein [Candidatus Omnitrophota bacterium]|nr:O-antigen ligase family protein [Candidatus Omnitrophota bacterium]
MFYAILLLIFCRPFISSLSFPVLNLVYSAVLLLFLIIWVIVKRAGIQKNLPAKLKPPLILFILSLIVSTLFSQDKAYSLKEFPQYLTGLLLFIIPFSLSPENKKRVLSTIILSGLGISLLAIYQYFFGFEYILNYLAKEKTPPPGLIGYLSQRRAFLPFISPNTLAGYLIIIIPLSLAFKKRIFFILPLGLALFFTKSLGALFSLFLGLTLYFYLNNQKGRKKIALLSSLSAIILLIFLLRQNSGSQFNQPGFSMLRRWDYWKETLGIIKLFPFLGTGLGALNLSQSRYAHNAYLQIWAEMGTLGIISFLWIIYETYNLIKRDFPGKKEISGLAVAIFAFLIHNLIDFTFFLPEVSLIWWIISGIYFSSHEDETCATLAPEPVIFS